MEHPSDQWFERVIEKAYSETRWEPKPTERYPHKEVLWGKCRDSGVWIETVYVRMGKLG